ncbi:MAG TPA: M15 family metallopeptidase [Candidatus Saccharimonadales bacterium]|nr:M15 family metallopeptidase [Candidatus Saccharimonadales bacterium]
MKKVLIVLCAVTVLGIGWLVVGKNNTAAPETTSVKQAATFDKKQFSLDDPSSIWVIANKRNPLQPKEYTPADLTVPNIPLRQARSGAEMQLRAVAARALEAMAADAKQDGLDLMLSSGYRSYAYQMSLYNYYVNTQGKAAADSQSARAGFSEHQTGLAADVEPASRECEVEECFGDTPEGKWVAANAHTYGFIIRYPEGKQATTGYIYEPWHLRYVGKALATELHEQGIATLEDFFGLGDAPDYQ